MYDLTVFHLGVDSPGKGYPRLQVINDVKMTHYEGAKYSEYSPKKLVPNLHTCCLSKLDFSGF